jgi:hypothetical protein
MPRRPREWRRPISQVTGDVLLEELNAKQETIIGFRLHALGRENRLTEGGTARCLKNRLNCDAFSLFRTGKRKIQPVPEPSESLWMENFKSGTGEVVWA